MSISTKASKSVLCTSLRFGLIPISLVFAGLIPNATALAAGERAPVRVAKSSMPDAGIAAANTLNIGERVEHLRRLGIESLAAIGHRGQGLKVAVLDSGFRGYRGFLGKALPAQVTTRSFRSDNNLEAKDSQHGILCGEVVHTVAPDADLLFANWEPDQPEQFLNAVRWARTQGAQILTCSVIMPSWGDGEGGGKVHEELARILGHGELDGDTLFFACAGNVAERHWWGPFHAGQDGFHEWQPGHIDNQLTPWGDERASIEVCWAQNADYDVSVIDQASAAAVSSSLARTGSARCAALVRFEPKNGHTYQVRVRLAQGSPGLFHCTTLHCGLEYTNFHGSIPFPGDGPEVITVGAVTYQGQRTSYSACGPNSKQPKPDLVAPVPFPSQWRPQPFGGTSAAAPQAAGLAALVWADHRDWKAGKVRNALEKSALDLGPPGHDSETGYGLIHFAGENPVKKAAAPPVNPQLMPNSASKSR